MKRIISALLCCLMCLCIINQYTNSIKANDDKSCIVTKDGIIICEDDLPSECIIDYENNEVVCSCPVEPLQNKCETCVED